MAERERERLLAECLEAWHRRRALGETPAAEEFAERLGEHLEDFAELLAAESAIDALIEPPPSQEFPHPFGEYTLLAELGRGAMGVVYEAVHRNLGRKVALKVLRTGFDTEPLALERFRREARACAQVRHDNIVEIYEVGQVEGRPFYAMPLLVGRSLSDLVRAGETPDPKSLARGLAGIADALQALHDAGIVHRDVKPGNIMVEPSGRMVLADFGLARSVAAHSLTQTGQALGTPLYMSPEQLLARKDAVDGRTDVYGLGVSLYEALGGRAPFQADDTSGLMRMILNVRPRPLPDLAPDLPLPICFVAMKAMERRPEDRYQSAGEMRDDLLAFAEGGEVTGRPVSTFRYTVRRLRRYWLPAAAVLLVAVGLAVWSRTRPGTLVLTSLPVAAVTIDGEEAGRTPLEVSLRPGEHEVVLRLDGFGDRRRTVALGAGDTRTLDVELIVTDPDDVHALALLGSEVGVPIEPLAPVARLRGGPPIVAVALSPRGKVRIEDLARVRIEIDPESDADPSGTIEFRKSGALLAELPFDPAGEVTEVEVPAAVLAALAPGDELTFSVRPRGGEPVAAAVQVVPSDLAGRIDEIEARLSGQPWVVRSHLRAQLFLDRGLYAAAAAEAERIVAERPESARALAVLSTALGGLGLRDTRRGLEVRERLDRLEDR